MPRERAGEPPFVSVYADASIGCKAPVPDPIDWPPAVGIEGVDLTAAGGGGGGACDARCVGGGGGGGGLGAENVGRDGGAEGGGGGGGGAGLAGGVA